MRFWRVKIVKLRRFLSGEDVVSFRHTLVKKAVFPTEPQPLSYLYSIPQPP